MLPYVTFPPSTCFWRVIVCYTCQMRQLFMPLLAVGILAFNSCGGGGGGNNSEDPKALAPSSLLGWAIVFDQMDGGNHIRDIQALILSEESGILSVNSGGEYVSGLSFKYQREGDTRNATLVISENQKDHFTITLNIIFDEYDSKGIGSTAFGHLQSWSYIEQDGINVSGSTGRVSGRRQQ